MFTGPWMLLCFPRCGVAPPNLRGGNRQTLSVVSEGSEFVSFVSYDTHSIGLLRRLMHANKDATANLVYSDLKVIVGARELALDAGISICFFSICDCVWLKRCVRKGVLVQPRFFFFPM